MTEKEVTPTFTDLGTRMEPNFMVHLFEKMPSTFVGTLMQAATSNKDVALLWSDVEKLLNEKDEKFFIKAFQNQSDEVELNSYKTEFYFIYGLNKISEKKLRMLLKEMDPELKDAKKYVKLADKLFEMDMARLKQQDDNLSEKMKTKKTDRRYHP